MLKKYLCVLLCVAVLGSICTTVFATEEPAQEPVEQTVEITTITIRSLEDFLAFAENCLLDSYSKHLLVELKVDIDLTGVEFDGIPVFCGEFRGNGYKITGLAIDCSGVERGLFRHVTETGVISKLHVEGTVEPQGSRNTIGGLVGKNSGQILDCSFSGTVAGSDYIGGLVGFNTVSGIIENCEVYGSVQGNHFIGGIAGGNTGVIRTSKNYALVNTTPAQNSVNISDITTDTIMNTESSNTSTDIGGIAGTSSGVIRNCSNFADVGYMHMGYNIGGIAGTQMGYIVGCKNEGNVSGRKDVGGIVGQMEPQTEVEYSEDALQMLKGQLNDVAGTTNRLGANAAAGGNRITGNISGLEQHMGNAEDALNSLIPDENNGGFMDPDTVTAAQNTLSNSITGMENSVSNIASAASGMISSITSDINALSNQIDTMKKTIEEADNYLGGRVIDVSDQDTPEQLTGKVESCTNGGEVLGDSNVGGIAGAMSPENDLDLLEDVEQIGDLSLNYEGKMRCVVLSCRNAGTVTAKKDRVGGIVGLMPMGLVKDCTNTGALEASAADYVGGIAGESAGFIRANFVRSSVSGAAYVGGIAGSANVVTDCRSMMALTAIEKQGGVVGYTSEMTDMKDNYYLATDEDLGGIDGVSYEGIAQGQTKEAFLAEENLPDIFNNIMLTFRFEDRTIKTVMLKPGEALQEAQIPEIPAKDGYISHWEGLDGEEVAFDREFTVVYTQLPTVIQNVEADILASGCFALDAAITVEQNENAPVLKRGQKLLLSQQITVSGAEELESIRVRLPEDAAAELIFVMVYEDGTWQEAACKVEKSYVVIPATDGQMQIAVLEKMEMRWIFIASGACLVTIMTIIGIVVSRKKKKK